MKKFYYSLAAAALVFSMAGTASAKGMLPTPKCECANKEECAQKCPQKMMNDKNYKMHENKTYKMHHKNKKWIDEATKEVNENYNEAVKKVNASKLDKAQKDLLLKQAEANRTLVLKQIDERTEFLKENMQKCMDAQMFAKESKHDKEDRKAIRSVHKILTDN